MEEILYNKHKEIDECKKFIEFIEKYFLNSNKSASNSNILINLLNQKLKILNSLDYQNCKNLVLSFEKLDDEIYNQIEILKSEIKGDIKNFTYYKQIKYNVDNINKNLKKDKNLSITKIIEEFLVKNEYFEKYIYKKSVKVKREAFFDIFNFIKNHQWISTLLFFAFGFVIYILFFLSQHYIPSISQSEFIYQIIQTSGIFLLIPFFIFLFVFGVMYLYVDYKKNKNYFDCLMSILYIIIFICFILLFILLLICIIYIIFIRGFKIAEIYFVFFIILSIFLFWIVSIRNFVNKNDYLLVLITGLILMVIGVNAITLVPIFKTLNISDIEYKYIVLDKKADEFLPDDMIYKFNCDKEVEIISYINSNLTYKTDNGSKIRNLKDKDCLTFIDDNNKTINTDNKKFTFKDGNLTFTEKKNNTIQNVKASFNNKSCLAYIKYKNDSIVLYNIEAISTLGEYWYIKTKFDDKFELQSDFIKTKVKK
ncbi:hypothetical protein [Campylobacter ureolyticus]|uniref:Uncharacterized protein n=1 Tax=Campylobacter ureolyticus TaxID=827 RepID=A0A9Q4KP20_9BACT|nr:hypothetical protein [Campylobacter ureolyticus]MCZ6134265.1 hypothetical protein [Campylobacter ureolyticus]MCZ6161309.1 hypothetical protein [Campylobacter ureolyticus]MCZ6170407.1 hypothetical protein [Campylobacter ureolyticus]